MPGSRSTSSPRCLGLLHLLLRAQVGPHRVVELQVAAAGVVERLDGLAVDLGEVVEIAVHVRVGVRADGGAAAAEVHHRRRGDGHLRHDLADRLQEPEVLEHGMVGGEVELARDLQAFGLGVHAVELDALIDRHALAALQAPEEVEVPPGAAELAVGDELEADRLLLGDQLADLLVLHGGELRGRDGALGVFGARLLERRGAQQAADHVGAEWGDCILHGCVSSQSGIGNAVAGIVGGSLAEHAAANHGALAARAWDVSLHAGQPCSSRARRRRGSRPAWAPT